jgi:hypothetical protein
MQGNRIRIFSELVSLDAWHLPFTDKRTSVALHADVGFSTARLGGEEESPVRFKVDLKRAELRIIVPETEPLSIDSASVQRIDAPRTKTLKDRSVKKTRAGAGAEVSGRANATGLSGTAALRAAAAYDTEQSVEVVETRKVGMIVASHSLDADGNHRWTFSPNKTEPRLDGKPWAAKDFPLLTLKDQRLSPRSGLSSTVRLELSCYREDLNIFDIRLKDGNLLDALKETIGFANRMIAAEAFIRNRLEREGLPAPRMAEDYAVIELAQITASEEG